MSKQIRKRSKNTRDHLCIMWFAPDMRKKTDSLAECGWPPTAFEPKRRPPTTQQTAWPHIMICLASILQLWPASSSSLQIYPSTVNILFVYNKRSRSSVSRIVPSHRVQDCTGGGPAICLSFQFSSYSEADGLNQPLVKTCNLQHLPQPQ